MHAAMKAMIMAAVFIILSIVNLAQANGQQTGSEPREFENVEKLLDNVARYNGQKVIVSGKVEKRLTQKAFLLESGGLFDNAIYNEIVVLIPEGDLQVREGRSVTVTGTVRVKDPGEAEREYGREVDQDIKMELKNVEAFLVAERIELQE